jgi:hypothetical protein
MKERLENLISNYRNQLIELREMQSAQRNDLLRMSYSLTIDIIKKVIHDLERLL